MIDSIGQPSCLKKQGSGQENPTPEMAESYLENTHIGNLAGFGGEE